MILPILVLVAWTCVMFVWMYATRIPAMQKAKINPDSLVVQGAPALKTLLPTNVSWIADNYNHLHEQPTVFYALALALEVGGYADGTAILLAWVYVALRIIHSFVQALVNKVMVRFSIFVLSGLVLCVMVVRGLFAALS